LYVPSLSASYRISSAASRVDSPVTTTSGYRLRGRSPIGIGNGHARLFDASGSCLGDPDDRRDDDDDGDVLE